MSSASLTSPAVPEVLSGYPSWYLRARRDVRSRRTSRTLLRRSIRTTMLAAVDTTAVSLGTLAMVALSAGRASLALLPLMLVLALLGQVSMRTYGPSTDRRSVEASTTGLVIATLATALLGSTYSVADPSFRDYAVFFVVAGLSINGFRQLADHAVTTMYRNGFAIERMLVIGMSEDEMSVREHYRLAGEWGVEVIGHVAPEPEDNSTSIGMLDELGDVLERHSIDRVVISAGFKPRKLHQVVGECLIHGAAVSIIPRTLSELAYRVSSRTVLGWPMLELQVPRLHALQVVLKRSFDVVLATLALAVLAPVLALVALAVRIDSPGSVLFRQRRLGVGGRPFTIYKFRSMRVDAEEVLRANPELYQQYLDNDYKLPPEADPRISRLGRFLRGSSLDELPQLVNVLCGDMSLVGPRPIVPNEIKEYGQQALTFLGVKPGVTGYWQVSGRSDIGYPERAELDVNYIMGWSLALDLKILCMTVPAVLARRGAH
jgi:exopolysaccharide production protein ExoY